MTGDREQGLGNSEFIAYYHLSPITCTLLDKVQPLRYYAARLLMLKYTRGMTSVKRIRLLMSALLVAVVLAACDTVSPGAPTTGTATQATAAPADSGQPSAYPVPAEEQTGTYPVPAQDQSTPSPYPEPSAAAQ